MSGLAWKLNRLRTMGVAEIAYRMRQVAQARLERLGVGLAKPREPRGACGRPWLAELPRDFDVAAYRAAADRVPAGRFDVFAFMENHDNPHIGDYNPQYETYRVQPCRCLVLARPAEGSGLAVRPAGSTVLFQ